MDVAGTEQLPGSESECPLPRLPLRLKPKSRVQATLKKFYQDLASYLLLVDKTAATHKHSEMSLKLAMPMCDILCLAYTKLKSKKKIRNIAKKVTRKYEDVTMKETNTCSIYQPVTIIKNLNKFLKHALQYFEGKADTQRTRRASKRCKGSRRKSKQSKTCRKKSKPLKNRNRSGRRGKQNRKQGKAVVSHQTRRT
ncbi:uncharacterized protein LOC110452502 [Mizuhopecten yessoensis]|nr:uncharacterized protein LOC110452502 [Mizuhopecten yessoensis]